MRVFLIHFVVMRSIIQRDLFNTDNERVTLRISLRDIVGAMAHFGRTLPIIMLYTTPGCAGAIRSRLRMSNKSGPFYDSRGAGRISIFFSFCIRGFFTNKVLSFPLISKMRRKSG